MPQKESEVIAEGLWIRRLRGVCVRSMGHWSDFSEKGGCYIHYKEVHPESNDIPHLGVGLDVLCR